MLFFWHFSLSEQNVINVRRVAQALPFSRCRELAEAQLSDSQAQHHVRAQKFTRELTWTV